jgi:hypothetical protein
MSQSIFYFLFSILLAGVLIGIVLIMMSIVKYRRFERRAEASFKKEELILLAKIKARLNSGQVKTPAYTKRHPIKQD